MPSNTTEPAITHTPERKEYIQKKIEELSPWYHSIDLGDGIVTPGKKYDRLWDAISSVMDVIDYKDKDVLDIASWDGKWAFQAESRGAANVVSSDVRTTGFANLLFVREVLNSKVVPLCNAPVNKLETHLQVEGIPDKFDIVHHLGLLYHLRDPLLSFTEVRAVMEEGGIMVLETAFVNDDKNSFMAFAGLPGNYHFYGVSDTWAPTKLCLREMLLRSMFKPIHEEAWRIVEQPKMAAKGSNLEIGRIAMLAKALPEDSVHKVEKRKMKFA